MGFPLVIDGAPLLEVEFVGHNRGIFANLHILVKLGHQRDFAGLVTDGSAPVVY